MNITKSVLLRSMYDASHRLAVTTITNEKLAIEEVQAYVFENRLEPKRMKLEGSVGMEAVRLHCLIHAYLWVALNLLDKKGTKKLMLKAITYMRAADFTQKKKEKEGLKEDKRRYKELKELALLCLHPWVRSIAEECVTKFGVVPREKDMFKHCHTVPKKKTSAKKHERMMAAQYARDFFLKKESVFFDDPIYRTYALYAVPKFLFDEVRSIQGKSKASAKTENRVEAEAEAEDA